MPPKEPLKKEPTRKPKQEPLSKKDTTNWDEIARVVNAAGQAELVAHDRAVIEQMQKDHDTGKRSKPPSTRDYFVHSFYTFHNFGPGGKREITTFHTSDPELASRLHVIIDKHTEENNLHVNSISALSGPKWNIYTNKEENARIQAHDDSLYEKVKTEANRIVDKGPGTLEERFAKAEKFIHQDSVVAEIEVKNAKDLERVQEMLGKLAKWQKGQS